MTIIYIVVYRFYVAPAPGKMGYLAAAERYGIFFSIS